MKDLDHERIRRFFALSKDLKFQDFIKWLDESLTEERVLSDTIEDTVKLRHNQGVRQNLSSILDQINNLPMYVEELKNN